jgi:hypothetical protein
MQFSLRTLLIVLALWLMVVVGMGVGWWLDRRELEGKISKLKTDAQMTRAVDGLY